MSIGQKSSGISIFSGKVKNTTVNSVAVYKKGFFQKLGVDDEGFFRDTLEIHEPGYFTFK